jgi:hypothetical protein
MLSTQVVVLKEIERPITFRNLLGPIFVLDTAGMQALNSSS